MNHIARIAAALVLGACQAPPQGPGTTTGQATQAVATTAKAAACEHHEGCGEQGDPGAHQGCSQCGAAVDGIQVPDEAATTKDPATGAMVTLVGAKLNSVPVTPVADLLARPQAFAGKTVRLEGNVTAMCSHRRAWFAIQSEDRSGASVRVWAAPAFLVPAGSIGKKARTEGLVEVTQNGVVLHATGAELL